MTAIDLAELAEQQMAGEGLRVEAGEAAAEQPEYAIGR